MHVLARLSIFGTHVRHQRTQLTYLILQLADFSRIRPARTRALPGLGKSGRPCRHEGSYRNDCQEYAGNPGALHTVLLHPSDPGTSEDRRGCLRDPDLMPTVDWPDPAAHAPTTSTRHSRH